MKKMKMMRGNSLSFEQGCELYLNNCRERNLRQGTINHYRQSYVQFYKFFDRDMPVKDISEDDYKAYILHLRSYIDNDRSINSYLRDFMENKETAINESNKVTETLTKELESLSNEELHEFFKFFYKMNHSHSNMMYLDQFEEFLGSFENNPFRVNEDKKFRKQLIDNIIKYSTDYMSLITAAVLIKKKFNMEELTRNYYASVDVFDGNWY